MPRSAKSSQRPRAPLARYSNYFEVGHNAYEFLIDFGQFQPEVSEVVFHTRIAVGPELAKLLHGTLHGAVAKYEAENGPIQDIGGSPDPLEVLLRSLPDFEHRAVDARRRSGANPHSNAPKRSTLKR